MRTQDSDNGRRESLGFAQAVIQYIAPLLAEKGFTCTERTLYWVKFQSPNVYFAVFHEPLSYEIDVDYARMASRLERYSLPNVLDALLGPGQKQKGYFQASTREGIVESIRTIADLLRTYGGPVLAGDPAAYKRIRGVARQLSEAGTKQLVQSPIRAAAEAAWKEKDYGRVKDLYQSIEADLIPLEKKRLSYARSHSTGA